MYVYTTHFRDVTGAASLKIKQIECPTDRKDCYRIELTYGTGLFMAFDLNFYVLDLVMVAGHLISTESQSRESHLGTQFQN